MEFIQNNLNEIAILILLLLISIQDNRVSKLQKRVDELENDNSKQRWDI